MSRRLTRFALLWFGLALLASACSRTTVISEAERAAEQTTTATDDRAEATADASADTEGATDDADDDDASPTTGDGDDPADASSTGDDEGASADSTGDDGTDSADALGIGGTEQIAGLTADCQAGSEMACDILFQASGLDTPEEQIARTCGGRRPDNVGFCTDAILPDGGNLWFDEDSPGLPAVVGACEVGFMTACDFLYFRSAVGSTYEEIGNTCSGRIEIAIPDCRTAFPED